MTQAPGANNESKLGGLSIDGASAGENRYIIDGIETTNLQSGISGKNVIADFVEEVQVKSSGYTAEFGGATGGVINVDHQERHQRLARQRGCSTRRAAALRRRDAGVGPTTADTGVPTLRISLTDPNKAEYVTYPKDDVEPVRARLRARRPDRDEPRVVLRRVSAGADDRRARRDSATAQPGAARSTSDAEDSRCST